MTQKDPQTREFAEERSSLFRLTLAPTTWALHFVICYGATAIWCEKLAGPDGGAAGLRLFIALVTVISVGIIVALGWKAWRQWDYLDDYDYVHDRATGEHRHEFLGHAAFLLSIVSLIGVVYTALPALVIASCV